jgi:hypothetical protein
MKPMAKRKLSLPQWRGKPEDSLSPPVDKGRFVENVGVHTGGAAVVAASSSGAWRGRVGMRTLTFLMLPILDRVPD